MNEFRGGTRKRRRSVWGSERERKTLLKQEVTHSNEEWRKKRTISRRR